jgi:hypothetical protein
MNEAARVWPICPRPEVDESLPSWFERVCHEYQMSPLLLLRVLEREACGKTAIEGTRGADGLLDPAVAERIAVLGPIVGRRNQRILAAGYPVGIDGRRILLLLSLLLPGGSCPPAHALRASVLATVMVHDV